MISAKQFLLIATLASIPEEITTAGMILLPAGAIILKYRSSPPGRDTSGLAITNTI
ncbi:hypothetical protein [uncultured Chitinophaga sp.]|uniref:hypothetical protein n=1 Tax=uncultured Chitinophaga sp. TaxID=339340 RepID=UPI0025ED8218|nr:hypothetical protein [uncultured Chitinophaga sp.]